MGGRITNSPPSPSCRRWAQISSVIFCVAGRLNGDIIQCRKNIAVIISTQSSAAGQDPSNRQVGFLIVEYDFC